MDARLRTRLAAGLAFVLVAFALNSLMTRVIVSRDLLDPGLTTAVRFLAGTVSLSILLASRHRLGRARPSRRNLLPAIWLGSYALLISYGYRHIGAAAGSFVFYACVLTTMTAGGAIGSRERVTPRALLGSLVALAGIGTLVLGRTAGTTPLGILLLAGTGISWGMYSLSGRGTADPLIFTGSNFLSLGMAIVAPTALIAAGAMGPHAMTLAGVLLAAFMGAVTTALSYAVWYWCLARIGANQAGTYQLAIPVITGVLAVAVLGEPLTLQLVIAGLLVVTGMGLVSRR